MTDLWPCGHPRTAENTQHIGVAGVRCRICRRAIALRSKHKRMAEDPEERREARRRANHIYYQKQKMKRWLGVEL